MKFVPVQERGEGREGRWTAPLLREWLRVVEHSTGQAKANERAGMDCW